MPIDPKRIAVINSQVQLKQVLADVMELLRLNMAVTLAGIPYIAGDKNSPRSAAMMGKEVNELIGSEADEHKQYLAARGKPGAGAVGRAMKNAETQVQGMDEAHQIIFEFVKALAATKNFSMEGLADLASADQGKKGKAERNLDALAALGVKRMVGAPEDTKKWTEIPGVDPGTSTRLTIFLGMITEELKSSHQAVTAERAWQDAKVATTVPTFPYDMVRTLFDSEANLRQDEVTAAAHTEAAKLAWQKLLSRFEGIAKTPGFDPIARMVAPRPEPVKSAAKVASSQKTDPAVDADDPRALNDLIRKDLRPSRSRSTGLGTMLPGAGGGGGDDGPGIFARNWKLLTGAAVGLALAAGVMFGLPGRKPAELTYNDPIPGLKGGPDGKRPPEKTPPTRPVTPEKNPPDKTPVVTPTEKGDPLAKSGVPDDPELRAARERRAAALLPMVSDPEKAKDHVSKTYMKDIRLSALLGPTPAIQIVVPSGMYGPHDKATSLKNLQTVQALYTVTDANNTVLVIPPDAGRVRLQMTKDTPLSYRLVDESGKVFMSYNAEGKGTELRIPADKKLTVHRLTGVEDPGTLIEKDQKKLADRSAFTPDIAYLGATAFVNASVDLSDMKALTKADVAREEVSARLTALGLRANAVGKLPVEVVGKLDLKTNQNQGIMSNMVVGATFKAKTADEITAERKERIDITPNWIHSPVKVEHTGSYGMEFTLPVSDNTFVSAVFAPVGKDAGQHTITVVRADTKDVLVSANYTPGKATDMDLSLTLVEHLRDKGIPHGIPADTLKSYASYRHNLGSIFYVQGANPKQLGAVEADSFAYGTRFPNLVCLPANTPIFITDNNAKEVKKTAGQVTQDYMILTDGPKAAALDRMRKESAFAGTGAKDTLEAPMLQSSAGGLFIDLAAFREVTAELKYDEKQNTNGLPNARVAETNAVRMPFGNARGKGRE